MPGWLGACHNYGFHVSNASQLVLRHFPVTQQWAGLWDTCLGYRGQEDNSSPLKELEVRDARVWMAKIQAIILSPCMEEATGELVQTCQEHHAQFRKDWKLSVCVPPTTIAAATLWRPPAWPCSSGPVLVLPIACSEYILELCLY